MCLPKFQINRHSAGDWRYRILGASAYRIVPYSKQSQSENKEFRRDFKLAQNQQRSINEVNIETQRSSGEDDQSDCFDNGNETRDVGHSKNFQNHVIQRLQTKVCFNQTN